MTRGNLIAATCDAPLATTRGPLLALGEGRERPAEVATALALAVDALSPVDDLSAWLRDARGFEG